MGKLNDLFPVMLLITCLVASVAVILALNVWDLIVFIYHQFWGAN